MILKCKARIVEEVPKGVKAGNALSLTLLSQNPRRVEPWARLWEKGNSLRREAAL